MRKVDLKIKIDMYDLKIIHEWILLYNVQKQPLRGVLEKRCSENMQQIYWRTPIPKCDFNKVAKQFYWNRTSASVFSCDLVHIFITAFLQNTSGRLLLEMCHKVILENGRILGLISDSYKDQKCAIKLLIIILML